jgi:hypothetical protein
MAVIIPWAGTEPQQSDDEEASPMATFLSGAKNQLIAV